ncbi:low temperature requirement A [Desulfovibrio sp. X2]|uniref:low temperature requirement protein A n=1 Tax=Desulfovibrio sp. X2 TaxID=941449 RepID=UPI000358BD9C|nr:low temperature requirement protein A [Desulfovibrio sp. X2]EPR41181.1 low temperature requirement A [Desulfovibrio sp. X2]
MRWFTFRNDSGPPSAGAAPAGEVKERHATWVELFFDLVFVAAVSRLATNLDHDYTPSGLLRFAAVFFPVWWAWIGHTFYLTRFDTGDIRHRLLTILQIAGVGAMVVTISGALGPTSAAFALSYAAVRFLLVVSYLVSVRRLPAARPLVARFVTGFGAAAALWAVSALVPPPWRFAVWGLAMVVDVLAPLTAGDLHAAVPPHPMHLPERFGLFTIIVIGEQVVAVMASVGAGAATPASVLAGAVGFAMASAYWWGYFEGARGARTLVLRSGRMVMLYHQWLYAHLPLVMGIVSTAVGIRLVVPAPNAPLPGAGALILCLSVAATMLSLAAISFSSCRARRLPRVRRNLAMQLAAAALAGGLGLLGPRLPGLVLLAVLAALCIAQVLIFPRRPGDEGESC